MGLQIEAPGTQRTEEDPIARAIAALKPHLDPRGLTLRTSQSNDALVFQISDAAGQRCDALLARPIEGRQVFRANDELSIWYRGPHGPTAPAWVRELAGIVADVLLSEEHQSLAGRLPRTSGDVWPGPFPRRTELDMVRAGVKPAASALLGSERDPSLSEVPATARSPMRYAFTDYTLADAAAERNGKAFREMIYVGQSQRDVDRLCEIDALLAQVGDGPANVSLEGREVIVREFGRLMGYPDCCTASFSAAPVPKGFAYCYYALRRLGWHMKPVDSRLNYVLALIYTMPFLIHVPCSTDCAPTAALVDRAIGALYPPWAQAVLRSVLAHGVVVYADDTLVPFRPTSGVAEDGSIAVEAFNCWPHPGALPAPVPHPVAPGAAGIEEARVKRLRARGPEIEVMIGGEYTPFRPRTVQARPSAPPLVLLPIAK